jgi:hypothetical protein
LYKGQTILRSFEVVSKNVKRNDTLSKSVPHGFLTQFESGTGRTSIYFVFQHLSDIGDQGRHFSPFGPTPLEIQNVAGFIIVLNIFRLSSYPLKVLPKSLLFENLA